MIGARQIRETFARAHHLDPPVLSLYLIANPSRHGYDARSVVTRAKATLDALPVPEAITRRVLRTLAQERPFARTLCVFVDAADMEILPLPFEIEVEDPQTGHDVARWGEPYMGPLLVTLDENEHHGVLYVDRDRWRFFQVSFGGIEEAGAGERPPSPQEGDRLEAAPPQHPAYRPERGGAARDLANAHLEDRTRRFFQDIGAKVEGLLAEGGLRRLLVMGPEAEVRRFESVIPPALEERIGARLPGLSSPVAPAGEVLGRVAPVLAQLRSDREAELLDEVGERGIRGPAACLRELQNNRVRALVVPWRPAPQPAYRDRRSGFVALAEEEVRAQALSPDDVELVSVDEILPDLAATYNVGLEFVRGDGRRRLLTDLGGMGATRRF